MVDVAAILSMHRQSVSSYVKKFKEHALEGLLTRGCCKTKINMQCYES
ncbi:helix-turn-helix domain-containing protein, partial [Bacillus wiedmannii]